MTLYDATDATVTASIDGPPATVTATVPGQNARVTFAGAAGQRVAASLSPFPVASPVPSLVAPDGATLQTAVYSVVQSNAAYFDAVTLPVAGSYAVFVNFDDSAFAPVTGSVTVTVYTVPADVIGTIMVGGPAVPVTTTVGGQNARLTFAGTAGQRVSAAVNLAVPVRALTILNPDGSPL